MAFYRCGGGGVPASVKTDMNEILNKKFGTSSDYPPADWAPTVNLMGPLPEKTVSGSVASITDGADAVPLKNWLVTLPASLSGYSEVNGTQTGANLLNFPNFILNFGVTNSAEVENSAIFPVGQYTITFDIPTNTTTKTVTFVIHDKKGAGATQQAVSYISAGSTASKTITFTATMPFNYFYCYMSSSETTGSTISIENIMMVSGATSSPYVSPTAPTQYTASLGRTIYGGTADVVNGQGASTHNIVDLGSLTWTKRKTSSGHWRFTTQDVPVVINDDASHVPSMVCTEYTAISPTQSWNGVEGISCNTVISQLMVCDESYETASDFKTAVSGVYLVYPLATPTDFTFTPITPTPETALGVNNFWSDSGDTKVTYRADINLALGGQ